MAIEYPRYPSYDACLQTLLNLKADKFEVIPLLAHEREHFEKARILGYQPLYGICLVPDCPPIILAGFIDFADRVPEGEDMIDILLAPTRPGRDDIILAEKIRRELAAAH